MKLTTNRLIIDEIKASDKEAYFANISHDKKVLETFICTYVENLEELDISRFIHRKDMFAIRLATTNQLIGIILYFDATKDSCEVGYGIGSNYWNQGYGTEALQAFLDYLLNESNFETVYASFFTGNEASKRIMEKCGMTYDHFNEKELTYLDVERDLTYYSIKRKMR